MEDSYNILLFSYGTLQLKKVQLESFGRILDGEPDRLKSYRLKKLKITNQDVLNKSEQEFHPIAVKSDREDDFIEGTIFKITATELAAADRYEVSDYKRVLEKFASGKEAWVYVAK